MSGRFMTTNGLHPAFTKDGGTTFDAPAWRHFRLGPLAPAFRVDDRWLRPDPARTRVMTRNGRTTVGFVFDRLLEAELLFETASADGIRLKAITRNVARQPLILNRIALLRMGRGKSATAKFGKAPARIHAMELSHGAGRTVALAPPPASTPRGRRSLKRASDIVWVVFDAQARFAFLAGFETAERWMGQIEMFVDANGQVRKWQLGFDGGDLLVNPGEELALEEVLFTVGRDPWKLLESYADGVQQRHGVKPLPKPPVSWCSWYPYRLGVSEDRILQNAAVAAKRLKALGLSILEADLGWEKDQLPSAFEENAQFPHGLKWLAGKLNAMGFHLGAWKAPYSISEFDPLVKKHPEYLVCDAKGNPAPIWDRWYWEPHGKVFILDLTQPGAQQWLREKAASLKQRGVAYLKADFIGCIGHPLAKQRHNRRVVAGEGYEAARIGAEIIRNVFSEDLMLNCGGPRVPGKGNWPLLYIGQDTGNTGYISWDFHRDNFMGMACHLFMNNRWGIIQPSCLCVGLPGTLEEARARATIAFLAGGQVDISDNLLNLPEDRWDVLTRTLPPLGLTARPIDLFEPLSATIYDYSMTAKKPKEAQARQEHPPGSVWHLRVERDWDGWDLVGIFVFQEPRKAVDEKGESGTALQISRFEIPLARLNLPPAGRFWAYEFWSGQFLGVAPGTRSKPGGYVHPGDVQSLVTGGAPGMLDVSFFGPTAKLIRLTRARGHPWVVGSTFHQSSGAELTDVRWDARRRMLSGQIHRPPGESGALGFYCPYQASPSAQVDHCQVPLRQGANESWVLPVVTRRQRTCWQVAF